MFDMAQNQPSLKIYTNLEINYKILNIIKLILRIPELVKTYEFLKIIQPFLNICPLNKHKEFLFSSFILMLKLRLAT